MKIGSKDEITSAVLIVDDTPNNISIRFDVPTTLDSQMRKLGIKRPGQFPF